MDIIAVNIDEIQNKIKNWAKADIATAKAINDAMKQAKTAASKYTREKYTIKAKAIRRYEKVDNASPNKLIAKINYRASMTNLVNYKVTPSKPNALSGKIGAKLKASVQKGSSKAYHPSFVVSGGKVKASGGLVMRRWGNDNKLAPVYGPSISMLMNNDDSKKVFTKKAEEAYARRMIYWLDKELR